MTSPAWIDGEIVATCPVCHDAGAKRFVVATSPRTRYARCPDCGSLFVPDAGAPSYEDVSLTDELTSYYVEHLAAIDTIVDPLFTLDRGEIRQYVEVGCSFGFALDLARKAFGWEVRGIDPSALAQSGAKLLRLPIAARYFSEAEPLDPPPADLFVASEVLEHVADPHALMRAVAASITDRGIVVLSTPNAAAARPDMETGPLMQVLCPGYHLVIFSVAGLIRLAEAHGFVHHHIRETPTGISIFAARAPFAWDSGGTTDRGTYRRYLIDRLDSAPPDSALARGMLMRLMREYTIYKLWEDAEALVPRLLETFLARKIDLADPKNCRPELPPGTPFYAFARRYPMNLGPVFYALGLLAMLFRHDNPMAVACFDASDAWYRAVHDLTASFGMVDAESDQFSRRAREHAAVMAARFAPDDALDRFFAFSEAPALAECRERLFIELVNGGHYRQAERIFGAVRETTREREALNTVRLHLALGMLALNHFGDRAGARDWFGRAIAAALENPDDPEFTPFRQAAEAALLVAGPAPPPPRPAETVPKPPTPRWRPWRRLRG